MRKIRVLRIIARLNIGGPAIHSIILTSGLDKSRFETLLVCGSLSESEGDMLYFANENNVKPTFVPELQREIGFFNDIKVIIKFYKIIVKFKPDIVHTHTAKAGSLGRIAVLFYGVLNPFKGRIILVHTFHGHVFRGYFGKIKSFIFVFIERILSLFTLKIITVSDRLKKDLVYLKVSPENKIEVIPLGLDLDKFIKLPEKEMRPEEGISIGIVGRIVSIKNHRLFLDVAKLLLSEQRFPGLRFVVVGDGELRGWLEEYSRKLEIEKFVSFLGWKQHLDEIYPCLEIVALTSINEGTPVSLIEAMASGKPIIATDVGGVRDLLGNRAALLHDNGMSFEILERGIAVKPDDAVSFSLAISFLLQNRELGRQMGRRGREFACRQHDKRRLVADIEEMYTRLFLEFGRFCVKIKKPNNTFIN